ncbi:MAG: methyl-accepting chemotaxis protein [Roseiflexaceae bacterium]|nr:methyl-accepting chemotaxis protein [Roseiflexaceae bacterium]
MLNAFSPTRSLSVRMALFTIMTALIAMLALTLMTNRVATENAIASARHQIDTQTLNGIERVEMYLQDRRSGVALTAQLPLVRLMLSNQEDPEARARGQSVINAVQSTFNYETISLLNTAGQVVLSTNPALIGADRSQRPEVISAQRGALGMSDVTTDPNEDRVYLHFTAPSYGSSNQLIGIVNGRVPLDEIHRLVAMDANRSGKGSYSVIVDRYGIRLSIPNYPHLLFHPSAPLDPAVAQGMISARRFGNNTATLLQQATTMPEIVEGINLLDQRAEERHFFSGTLNSGEEGESVIRKLRSADWYYIHRVPIEQFYSVVREQTNYALLITAVAASVAVAVTLWFVQNSLRRPLLHLVETASAIAGGDLSKRLKMQRRDEVGVLASSFNAMADALEARITEAQAAQAEAQRLQRIEAEGRAALERSVAEYLTFVQRVANGDLSQTLRIDRDDVLGQLGEGLNRMVESLRAMGRQSQEAANAIAAAAAQILATTTQQASAANEQSAAVAQTMAALDEVRAIARQTADQADHVARDAQAALNVAQQGIAVVEETVQSMSDIRQRVEGIAQTILSLASQAQMINTITGTVSELADQSNLLALNAAIEAARAGEQGRSFSVVAQQVRDLAERSKQATVQVRSILGDIQKSTNAAVAVTEEGAKRVDAGHRLVSQAGDVIHRIASEVENGAQINVQMAASARQATAGLDQIGQALISIQKAASETLTSTRQAERAAQDLNALAQSLQRMVAVYRLA